MGRIQNLERMRNLDELEPIDFGYLQHHWGSAYVIRRWLATRKDNLRVIRADSAEELLDLIRLDYRAMPVPRTFGGNRG